jgi:signal transduction histidine kinase
LVERRRAERPDFPEPELADSPEHAIITYAWPEGSNRGALGMDLFTRPELRAVMQRAALGAPQMAEPVDLGQPPYGLGIVSYAVVRESLPDGTFGPLIGWTNTVVQGQAFVESLAGIDERVAIRIVEERNETELAVWPEGTTFDTDTALSEVTVLPLGGQTWRIELMALPSFLTANESSPPWIVLGAGLLLTLALSSLIFVLADREHRAHDMVADRTRDLVRANTELADANAALREANRVKDDFLAVVSHEFRTPLTVIRGFVTTIATNSGVLDDWVRDALLRIERNASRLDALVDDLLLTARLGSGAVQPTRMTVSVAGAVEETASELGTACPQLRLDLPGDLSVEVDRDHLRMILANLLSNAQKYGAPPVDITARAVGDAVRIEVRDHGPGIPPQHLPHLFEPFAQGETGLTRSSGGVGLGLSIVAQLCRLNGGSVRYVGSAAGAAFELLLPIAARSHELPPVDADISDASVDA